MSSLQPVDRRVATRRRLLSKSSRHKQRRALYPDNTVGQVRTSVLCRQGSCTGGIQIEVDLRNPSAKKTPATTTLKRELLPDATVPIFNAHLWGTSAPPDSALSMDFPGIAMALTRPDFST